MHFVVAVCVFFRLYCDMKRKIEEALSRWKSDVYRKPLILRGARQVGKTYSLRKFGREQFSAVHYVNFEGNETISKLFAKDLNPERIIQDLNFQLKVSINKKSDLVIFDEIQEVPQALTSLKYFNEEMPELAICAAGSLLGVHVGEASFPVGKIDFMDLSPLMFDEFLLALGEEDAYDYFINAKIEMPLPDVVHERIWECLKLYFVVGGMPEAVKTFLSGRDNLFMALEKVRKRQKILVTAYLADVAKHSGKLNAMHIERVWRNVPSQLAREYDGSVSRFRFKDIVPGINRYARLAGTIDWLLAAGLLIRVPIVNCARIPLSAYTKENIFKLYLFDVGILGAISGLDPVNIMDYDYGSYKGYFAESFVAQELVAAGHKELYGWSEGSAEVEFLVEHKGNILPLEVKSGWVTQAKSLRVYAKKYSPPFRTVMSAKNISIKDNGLYCGLPLYLAGRFPMQCI